MESSLSSFPSLDVFAEWSTTSSTNPTSSLVYGDLPSDHIRLLEISSAYSTSEVSCRIRQYPLSQKVAYTALSYAWGSKPDDRTVLLNGYRIPIRKNLHRFLCEARKFSPETFGLFWIDALCIDQSNIQERGRQVKLMPQIYRNARQVVVWLGPAYSGSNEAMDGLTRMGHQGGNKRLSKNTMHNSGAFISMLCRRPYWRRLWIFQEVYLARKIRIMCGDQIAPWEPFRDMLSRIGDNKRHGYMNVTSASRIDDSVWYQIVRDSPAIPIVLETAGRQDGKNLIDLMEMTKDLRCSVPSDKVYALLGTACRGCSNIEPDYDKPIPALLNDILRGQHEVERPEDLESVEYQCRMLNSILGASENSIFELAIGHGCSPTPWFEDVAAAPIGREGSSITLWWASYYGHSMVEKLMINDPGVNISHCLRHAAAHGNEATVKLILDTGFDIAAKAEQYGEALRTASENGHERVVQILIDAGADINFKEEIYDYALEPASKNGHEKVVQILIDAGADINAKVGIFGSALLDASFVGDDRVVQMLIDAGADVNAKGEIYRCALQAASLGGYEKVVRILLDAGADIDTPGLINAASARGYKKVVQMLMDAGVKGDSQKGGVERTSVHVGSSRKACK